MAAIHPTKPRNPHTRHAAYLVLVEAVGGFKEAAYILGRSESLVHAWGDPDSGREPPVWAVEALTIAAESPAMVEHLAKLIGAMVVPAAPEMDGELGRSLAATMKELAEGISAAADAMVDGIVTPAENRCIRQEFAEADVAARLTIRLLDLDYRAHNQESQ